MTRAVRPPADRTAPATECARSPVDPAGRVARVDPVVRTADRARRARSFVAEIACA